MCAQGALGAAGTNAIHYYAHRTDEREGCCMIGPSQEREDRSQVFLTQGQGLCTKSHGWYACREKPSTSLTKEAL